MEQENNVLVLRVDGKKDLKGYQKDLYEASVLGIEKVILIFTVKNNSNEKKYAYIRKMTQQIIKSCEILNLIPISTTVTFYGDIHFVSSVGSIAENEYIGSLTDLPKFKTYKRRVVNKKIIKEAEDFESVYQKKLRNM